MGCVFLLQKITEVKKMAFCRHCGHALAAGDSFCSGCGKAVDDSSTDEGRKSTYDGEIHKCPSCGEILESFVSNCPTCGFELRGVKVSSPVQELLEKLEELEEKRTEIKSEGLFGAKNYKRKSHAINQQKINLIRNFPIPNTKEDIMEFMILAASNMKAAWKAEESDIGIATAWKAKFIQAYNKAKICLNASDFACIQEIYDGIMIKPKKKALKITFISIGSTILVVLFIILMIFINDLKDIEKNPNFIRIGESSASLEGDNYQDVINYFESKGFTNIETRKTVIGAITKNGKVKSISIDGDNSFSRWDRFDPNAVIVITYHTF